MSFPPYQYNPVAFGNASYCSTGTMAMPTGSFDVRSIGFRIPRFTAMPSVSVRIIGDEDASPLTVYALKINDNVGGMTQIAIEAQTLDGEPAAGTHICNVMAVGPPAVVA